MRQIARTLLLSLALSPFLSLHAEPMEGLYRVVEPLPEDAQGQAREEGLRRAFDTLVLRLTGKPELAQSEALAGIRQDPQQVIRQFGYQGAQVLVEFDPASVQRHLQQAGIDTWGAERPELLAWWLVDTGLETQLVGDGQERARLIRDAAQYRGLPVALPLADLGEQLAVTPETLGQPEALGEVSARYSADALLGVMARQADGRWQANWRLSMGEQQTKGQVVGDSLESVVDAVMLKAHAWLAPQFVGRGGQAEPVLLDIENVDIGRLAEVERLLQPLGAQLVAVTGDRLTYRLTVDPAQLRAQLGLARLQEVPVEPAPMPALEPTAGEPAVQQPAIDASQAPQPPVEQASVQVEQGLHLRYRW